MSKDIHKREACTHVLIRDVARDVLLVWCRLHEQPAAVAEPAIGSLVLPNAVLQPEVGVHGENRLKEIPGMVSKRVTLRASTTYMSFSSRIFQPSGMLYPMRGHAQQRTASAAGFVSATPVFV